MNAILIDPQQLPPAEVLEGAVVCEEIRIDGKRAFRKGHRIESANVNQLARVDHSFPAIVLGPDDVHEDEAAHAIASLVAGPGVKAHGPLQSRINLKATHKGLLRVDRGILDQLNHLPDVSVFTLIDRMAVLPGKTVAGIKITPVATTTDTLAKAEEIVAERSVVMVKPFVPLTIGVVTTEAMDDKGFDRFRDSVLAKVGWYGGTVSEFREATTGSEAVANAMTDLMTSGADLIMSGGGNTINPFDPAMLALADLGAEIVRSGVPAHPGSMFWLAYLDHVPIFNLASCSMYSRSTVADLVLPWLMAGERVTTCDMDEIGYGGLLDRDMKFRFPPYEEGGATEESGD